MGMCRELVILHCFFLKNWGKVILQVRKKENREEGTKFLKKTEYEGEGLMGLPFQKAQGIIYPGGL